MTYLKNTLTLIGLFLIGNIIFSISYLITKNMSISYSIEYISIIIYFIIKYKKEFLISFKNIKFNKKMLIISFLLTFLSIMLHYIFKIYFNIESSNELSILKTLYSNKLIMGANILLLAPICEEFIFRYTFNNKNTIISLIIYTLLFTFVHLLNITSSKELIYFFPYLFMSLSISLQFYKNNNIFTSIIYHMLNNLINIMILFI